MKDLMFELENAIDVIRQYPEVAFGMMKEYRDALESIAEFGGPHTGEDVQGLIDEAKNALKLTWAGQFNRLRAIQEWNKKVEDLKPKKDTDA